MPRSTIFAATPDTLPAEDPFRYGWRYVPRPTPDAPHHLEQVPLTLEDVLHPEKGDQVLCNYDHQRRVRYLADVFLARVADHPDAVVLSDVRIAWDVPGLKAHGPDVMVIFDVQVIRNWSTFDGAVEGVRLTLIVEVTSPETRALDLEVKTAHYALASVPLYVIVDAHEQRGEALVRVLGYELADATYRRLLPNEQGWLWLEPLRVWIGVEGREVYCFDEQQRRIGDYATLTTIVIESEEQVAKAWTAAKAEARARMEAEARAREEAAARRIAEEQARREAEARAAPQPKRACMRSRRNCAGCAARDSRTLTIASRPAQGVRHEPTTKWQRNAAIRREAFRAARFAIGGTPACL